MKHINPPRAVYIVFTLVILLGGVLLHLPYSSNSLTPIPWLDAMFTSTSAICVTGLTVIDPGTDLSLFGQAIMFVLIQLGGIGIMTVSGFLFLLMRKNIGLRGRMIVAQERSDDVTGGIAKLIIKIFLFTISIETIGAFLLFWRLDGWHSNRPLHMLFFSFFHAVSAFCNAGFSLLSNSLISFYGRFDINIIIMLLIIFGGLGYPVLSSLLRSFKSMLYRRGKLKRKLDLHSRTVIYTSFWLVILGAIGIYLIEFSYIRGSEFSFHNFLASAFQAISARTAGFSTLETAHLGQATLFFLCALMFVGASPASTGGGIKTTSLAIIISAIRSFFLGLQEVSLFKRNIQQRVIRQAFVILTFSVTWVFLMTLILCITDPNHRLMDLLFECVSAYATVGLSTGITVELSVYGRFVIAISMLVGRLSAVTLLMSMTMRQNVPNYRYPDEKILL
ncbi:MAG: potassium transporter TrkG [Chlamydiota bacterium]|nr:potassium transporter TrkG [Chlamydiota bacterium]